MKTMIILSILLIFSCSNGDDDNNKEIQGCQSSQLKAEIMDSIPATVRKISDGEYFFDGNEFYLEVDAEKYLNTIASDDKVSLIRIFVPNKDLGDIDTNLLIKGSISTCLTGLHGRLTNNIHMFYLLENFSSTNN